MGLCHSDHFLKPGDRATLDLDAAETFVVAAMRCWVAPVLHPQGHHPDWRNVFRISGVAAMGLGGFDVMMAIIARSARRSLEVSCCHCPSLAADEIAMLRLVGSLHGGDTWGALSVLSDWLPPGAVTPALQAAQRFAAATVTAGLRLPTPAASDASLTALPAGALLH